MVNLARIVTQLILSLSVMLCLFSPVFAAEIDDSTLFVEAFNAYQNKDYLLAIEKCDQLNEVFTDSPLRDITLLLIARASLKSGNNARAAKSVNQFLTEFPDSSLKTTVEEELQILAKRQKKGEALAPDKKLQAAAGKVRSDTLAREQAARLKLEAERAAKAKAEQERLARIKREAERLEKERRLAEERARASIKAVITLPDPAIHIPAGGTGKIPFVVANTGTNREEFVLTISAAKEYSAGLTGAHTPDEDIRIQLAAGETYKGAIEISMPAGMVDGHRSAISIKAVSATFSDITFQKGTVVVSSAPLVRVVAKLAKQSVIPGEHLRYQIAVLNAGSLPARNLTVRLQLPPQIDFHGVADAPFAEEPGRTLAFKLDQVDTGKLATITLDVSIREDSAAGQQLFGKVEITDHTLHKNETFTAAASVVQAK